MIGSFTALQPNQVITMSNEWFRNKTWNEAIEQAFDAKLSRARRKEQYLRIQASTLACTYPKVCLKLLERYFTLEDNFDHAQAYVDMAVALLTLERLDAAIAAYEAALARESVFPKLQTQAYLDLPFVVATCALRDKYDRALHLLDLYKSRLIFPVDRFRWHVANALIAADSNEAETAREHAMFALEAAACDHSGFRYHPSIGLVPSRYGDVMRKMAALCTV